jgi:hypothetical protein
MCGTVYNQKVFSDAGRYSKERLYLAINPKTKIVRKRYRLKSFYRPV